MGAVAPGHVLSDDVAERLLTELKLDRRPWQPCMLQGIRLHTLQSCRYTMFRCNAFLLRGTFVLDDSGVCSTRCLGTAGSYAGP